MSQAYKDTVKWVTLYHSKYYGGMTKHRFRIGWSKGLLYSWETSGHNITTRHLMDLISY